MTHFDNAPKNMGFSHNDQETDLSTPDIRQPQMGIINPEIERKIREGKYVIGMGRIENAPLSESLWMCVNCGKTWKSGKFCANCGAPKPKGFEGWVCTCGNRGRGEFCSACGAPRPSNVCEQCGWKPAHGMEDPAFCPECGYVIRKDKSISVKTPDCQWG